MISNYLFKSQQKLNHFQPAKINLQHEHMARHALFQSQSNLFLTTFNLITLYFVLILLGYVLLQIMPGLKSLFTKLTFGSLGSMNMIKCVLCTISENGMCKKYLGFKD